MMGKVENLVRRMRWKAYFFEKDIPSSDDTTAKFGFKSNKASPQNEHLKPFENDLYNMIQTIEFKPIHNPLQRKMKKDLLDIRSSDNMLVFADKKTNLYSMHRDQYKKLLHENITKSYKKADTNLLAEINTEAAGIAQSLNLEDKMECYAQKEAFVTLKYHKENFRNDTK